MDRVLVFRDGAPATELSATGPSGTGLTRGAIVAAFFRLVFRGRGGRRPHRNRRRRRSAVIRTGAWRLARRQPSGDARQAGARRPPGPRVGTARPARRRAARRELHRAALAAVLAGLAGHVRRAGHARAARHGLGPGGTRRRDRHLRRTAVHPGVGRDRGDAAPPRHHERVHRHPGRGRLRRADRPAQRGARQLRPLPGGRRDAVHELHPVRVRARLRAIPGIRHDRLAHVTRLDLGRRARRAPSLSRSRCSPGGGLAGPRSSRRCLPSAAAETWPPTRRA